MPKRVEDRYGSINPPQYNSVAFAANTVLEIEGAFGKYGSRFAYGRMGNPDVKVFEEWFAEFEEVPVGSIWATNTGMAAESLVILGCTHSKLARTKRVVASPYLYGGVYHLLEIFNNNGIQLSWVEDPLNLESWEKAMSDGCPPACVLLETPSNPTVHIFDIQAIADIVHRHRSWLIVDNTLGVGLVNPLKLGADATTYSVTKYINRKSSDMGGAVVASACFRKEVEEVFDDLFVHLGMTMSPRSALVAYEGRTTLRRDMRTFSQNALLLAKTLRKHPKIKRMNYPHAYHSPEGPALSWRQMPHGGGGVLSFELENYAAAVRFVEEQQEAYLAVHLGDENNHLIIPPASTAHSKLSPEERKRLGIPESLVRVSVSLTDDMNPLINDFTRVLDLL